MTIAKHAVVVLVVCSVLQRKVSALVASIAASEGDAGAVADTASRRPLPSCVGSGL